MSATNKCHQTSMRCPPSVQRIEEGSKSLHTVTIEVGAPPRAFWLGEKNDVFFKPEHNTAAIAALTQETEHIHV